VQSRNYIDRTLRFANHSPGKTIIIGLALWGAALLAYGKFTEHTRFNAEFASAVWGWYQAGDHPRSLTSEDQRNLFGWLASSEPPERWVAARKLGAWRDPKALWPLIAAMGDGPGLEFEIIALLTGKESVENETLKVLQASSYRQDRWLASLARPGAGSFRTASAP